MGVAVLDVIYSVDTYPLEDSEVRASSQRVCRGGNATNSLVVLAQLGHECSWAGVMAEDRDAAYIMEDLSQHRIDMRHVVRVSDGRTPVSSIITSRSGSRTIVHYRDLPELEFDEVVIQAIVKFDWLHFEGRNIKETHKIMKAVRQQAADLQISLEIEKNRDGIEALSEFADHVFFSKGYMQTCGFDAPEKFLLEKHERYAHADLYCAQGEEGLHAVDKDGRQYFNCANNDITVVDTVGAGDALNAGLIHGCLQGLPMTRRLELACRLAARKCSQSGFDAINIKGL